MSRSYTSSCPCSSTGVLWDCFTFTHGNPPVPFYVTNAVDRTRPWHATVLASYLQTEGHSSLHTAAGCRQLVAYLFGHPSPTRWECLVKVYPGTWVPAITGPRGSLELSSLLYNWSRIQQWAVWVASECFSSNRCLGLAIFRKILRDFPSKRQRSLFQPPFRIHLI
jgi:hypothetical protein